MKKIQKKSMSNELFVSTYTELTGPDLHKLSPLFFSGLDNVWLRQCLFLKLLRQ
jgi:hypothetical protein